MHSLVQVCICVWWAPWNQKHEIHLVMKDKRSGITVGPCLRICNSTAKYITLPIDIYQQVTSSDDPISKSSGLINVESRWSYLQSRTKGLGWWECSVSDFVTGFRIHSFSKFMYLLYMNYTSVKLIWGFPGDASGKRTCLPMQET